MKSYCVLYIFLFVLLSACNNVKKENGSSVSLENIDYFSLDMKSLDDFLAQRSVKYILLKPENDDQLFGRIDIAKIISNKIYISDFRMHSLVVYDITGRGIAKVGRLGQGPNEYLQIADFGVDSQGNIYAVDGRLDKLLTYNSNFECIGDCKLPFEADVITITKEDSILYGLSSWNEGEASGTKIVLTDKNNKIFGKYFEYTDAVDPAFWVSNYYFAETKECIAYNQTINNDIYIFSHSGKLKKIFKFDFGKENVPDKDKMDIEANLLNFDNYTLLKRILAVTDQYIIGFLWDHRKTKMFVLDYHTNTCYLGNPIPTLDMRWGRGFCEDGIISYLDSEDESYPDSVNTHIENEGIVLQIQSIN